MGSEGDGEIEGGIEKEKEGETEREKEKAVTLNSHITFYKFVLMLMDGSVFPQVTFQIDNNLKLKIIFIIHLNSHLCDLQS